jgi:hypothetical protein
MKTVRSIQKTEKDAPPCPPKPEKRRRSLPDRLCLGTENLTLIQENRERNPLKLLPILKFLGQIPRFLEKMPIKRRWNVNWNATIM